MAWCCSKKKTSVLCHVTPSVSMASVNSEQCKVLDIKFHAFQIPTYVFFFFFKSTTLLEGQDQARIVGRGLERIGIQEMLRSEGEDILFKTVPSGMLIKTGRKKNSC